MSGLEKSLFQLKFTAKSLQRQSRKAAKDEVSEKAKLKKALQQGNTEGARIYASNAIRKSNESLNLLRLASRIDGVASRVETAVTMKQVTGSMTSVVKGMDKAMESMNIDRVSRRFRKEEAGVRGYPERLEEPHTHQLLSLLSVQPQISLVMDRFEGQFTSMDEQTTYMESSMGSSVASSTPQDQVDLLMAKVADENGIELGQKMGSVSGVGAGVSTLKQEESANKEEGQEEGEEDALEKRLKALRPAT